MAGNTAGDSGRPAYNNTGKRVAFSRASLGCQTEIAQRIVAADADYCLAVKGNQPTLHQGIVDFFSDHLQDDFARTKVRRRQTQEKGHGRQETRYYYLCPVPDDLPDRSRWKGLKAIGIAINITIQDGKETGEIRYYILSRYLSGRRFAHAVRGHWSSPTRSLIIESYSRVTLIGCGRISS